MEKEKKLRWWVKLVGPYKGGLLFVDHSVTSRDHVVILHGPVNLGVRLRHGGVAEMAVIYDGLVFCRRYWLYFTPLRSAVFVDVEDPQWYHVP